MSAATAIEGTAEWARGMIARTRGCDETLEGSACRAAWAAAGLWVEALEAGETTSAESYLQQVRAFVVAGRAVTS